MGFYGLLWEINLISWDRSMAGWDIKRKKMPQMTFCCPKSTVFEKVDKFVDKISYGKLTVAFFRQSPLWITGGCDY